MTTATIKSLGEMTIVELMSLKLDVNVAINRVMLADGDPAELVRFEGAIDDELWSRGV